jgi:copper oxidase (laccase) domain-containing protein
MSKTPFSFSHKNSPTKSPSKVASFSERIETQFKLFQKDIVQWKQLHESSVESLSEYISTVGLISPETNESDLRSLQIVAKRKTLIYMLTH